MAVTPARALILNGAGAGRGTSNLIALVDEGHVIDVQPLSGRGASEKFAPTVQAMLRRARWVSPPDMVAAVVGPGSFTGLRASLSLAAGLVRGWGCLGVGVRLGDAIRASIGRDDVTTLCLARRGRVFVDSPHCAAYALPVAEIRPGQWSAVAGDAVWGEDALPELTGEQGQACLGQVEYVPCAVPDATGIFKAACLALAQDVAQRGALHSSQLHALEPLYIDPPEARPPAGGLRPAPK